MIPGTCTGGKRPREFSATLTGQKLPHAIIDSESRDCHFKTCSEMTLLNGDVCTLNQFVIVRGSHPVEPTFIACVKEIIQIVGSVADLSTQPSGILIQLAAVSKHGSAQYEMPHVSLQDTWYLVLMKVCISFV